MSVVSRKLRESARGRDCTLRLPGVCTFDPATTVLAHLPCGQRGVGLKSLDVVACFACVACHDAIDGRRKAEFDAFDLLRALAETQAVWINEGLLKVK